MGVTVKDVDRGWLKFAATIRELQSEDPHVRVGVLAEDDHREGGFTNAEIAAVHEFGAPAANIPQRSFLRSSFEKHRDEYGRLIEKLLRRVLDRKSSVTEAFEVLGQRAAADVKNGITEGEGIPPPNAPSVYARKAAKSSGAGGGVRTLVDTGQLLAAITYAVFFGDKRKT